MVDVALYIRYAKVAQVKDTLQIAQRKFLRGGTTVPDYTRLLEIVRKSVEFMYDNNQSEPTLDEVANYMYNLSGKRGLTPTASTSPFVIVVHPASQTVSSGANVSFFVQVAGGTAPYFYQWSFGGVPISGETNQTLNLTNVDNTDAGSYTCEITDSATGDLVSNTATLTVNASLIAVFAVATDTDPFPLVSDGYTYTYNQNITSGANISWNLSNGDNNRFFIFKEPVSQPVKLFWDNFGNPGNSGPIPDQLMREPVILSGFRYYLTRQTYVYLNGTPTLLKTTV